MKRKVILFCEFARIMSRNPLSTSAISAVDQRDQCRSAVYSKVRRRVSRLTITKSKKLGDQARSGKYLSLTNPFKKLTQISAESKLNIAAASTLSYSLSLSPTFQLRHRILFVYILQCLSAKQYGDQCCYSTKTIASYSL